MNDDRFERDVASVLAGLGPTHAPDGLLADVFLTTGRMRPRPRWLALIKEPPMRYSSRVAVGSPTFRLITIAAITLLLLAASLAAVGVGARVLATDHLPAPFGLAKTGSLVLTAGGDIYLADGDGSNQRDIVTGPTLDQVPWFSLGGTKIAFGRGSENAMSLMVADADGSNATQLLHAGDWWAEFLPGDEQMVVTKPVKGQNQMSVIDVATGDTVRTFDLGSIVVEYWVFPRPPDGHELIFSGYASAGSRVANLYAIGLDGTGLRAIGEPSTDSDSKWSFLAPSMSPDGSTIVYHNWELADPQATEPGNYLHMRALDTGQELPVPFDAEGMQPFYSPDGRDILFERSTDDGTTNQMYLVPADGSRPAAPVGPPYPGQDSHFYGFSPDGTTVYLDQTGRTTLIDLATGETTELGGSGGPEAGGWQRLAP
jgi:Tol biopolymer transport system component